MHLWHPRGKPVPIWSILSEGEGEKKIKQQFRTRARGNSNRGGLEGFNQTPWMAVARVWVTAGYASKLPECSHSIKLLWEHLLMMAKRKFSVLHAAYLGDSQCASSRDQSPLYTRVATGLTVAVLLERHHRKHTNRATQRLFSRECRLGHHDNLQCGRRHWWPWPEAFLTSPSVNVQLHGPFKMYHECQRWRNRNYGIWTECCLMPLG